MVLAQKRGARFSQSVKIIPLPFFLCNVMRETIRGGQGAFVFLEDVRPRHDERGVYASSFDVCGTEDDDGRVVSSRLSSFFVLVSASWQSHSWSPLTKAVWENKER